MAMFGNYGSNKNDPRRKLALKMVQKKFTGSGLPPGLQKKAAGVQSARQFAPGQQGRPLRQADNSGVSKAGVPPVSKPAIFKRRRGRGRALGLRRNQAREQFISE